MKKLIFVSGPAGIGKSTYCQSYIDEHPAEQVFIISADEVRKGMTGAYNKFLPNNDMQPVYQEMVRQGEELAKNHESLTLIIDTTMLYDYLRLYFLENLKSYEYRILILMKAHDYSICLTRNRLRGQTKFVPEPVIISMCEGYTDPSDDCRKRFDEVKEVYVN